MSIIATTSNLSILIFTLSEVLGLRMTEKLHSHSAEVIGNVHDFQQNQQVRESFLNAFLNVFANVSDRSWKLLPTTCIVKVEVLDPQYLYQIFFTLFQNWEISTFSLNFSEHKTDGVKINNLNALQ